MDLWEINIMIMMMIISVIHWNPSSEETEIDRHKIQTVWWTGKTFPQKLLQDFHCDML
jgi:hypothetical protein